MKIDEHLEDDGRRRRTELLVGPDGPELVVTGGAGEEELCVLVDVAVIEALFGRYGAPPEQGLVARGPRLELGPGGALVHFRFLAKYDVIAKDWLLYEAPGREPLVALATQIAAALEHLARAWPSS